MRILITGSSGALGGPLASWLQTTGHQVIGVSRDPARAGANALPVISWEQLTTRFFGLRRIDAIINLAGAPMMQRWNPRNKAAILRSRLDTVRMIYELLLQLPARVRPECVVNVSSVSIYSSCTLPVDEFSIIRRDAAFFQAQVWHAVERRIAELHVPGVRTLITRLGLVVGADLLMQRMLRLSRCYLGSILGDGRQRISWISRLDLARAFTYLLTNTEQHGVFNIVTPRPMTAGQFGAGMARSVNRPALLRVPAGILRMLLGELATNFLTSADAMPARLQMAGFHWELPDFEQAMQAAARELGYGRRENIAASLAEARPENQMPGTETHSVSTIGS